MLLLHVSDIHFNHPQCAHQDTDPDRHYREAMLDDISEQVERLGEVSAILVGGDIAYKGDPAEFKHASAWLLELAEVTGCPTSRIFVVPGNHDVNRQVCTQQNVISQHLFIKNAADKERALRSILNDSHSRDCLFRPLEAYNDFAAQFGCQVYWPDQLYWRQNIELDHGVHLRIHGLNSTLLSGVSGANDIQGQLYMSPLQTALSQETDVINVVFAHHPPEWMSDNDDVSDVFDSRARLQIFGHRHRQRISVNRHYVRISAAAVNPDRREVGFEPGYNFIEARVNLTDAGKQLALRVHPRRWQDPDAFVARVTDGSEVVEVSFPIYVGRRRRRREPELAISATGEARDETLDRNGQGATLPNIELDMSERTAREYIYRFWQLSSSERRKICIALRVYDGDDESPEAEKYGRALTRIAAANKLEELGEQISKQEAEK